MSYVVRSALGRGDALRSAITMIETSPTGVNLWPLWPMIDEGKWRRTATKPHLFTSLILEVIRILIFLFILKHVGPFKMLEDFCLQNFVSFANFVALKSLWKHWPQLSIFELERLFYIRQRIFYIEKPLLFQVFLWNSRLGYGSR